MAAAGRSRGATWRFGAVIALLVGLLVVQSAYLCRDRLSQEPLARPWLEAGCAVVGCALPRFSDPRALQLRDRVFEQHPRRRDVIRLEGRLVNTAPFRQDFPNIHVRITDLDGQPLGVRRFTATDYLHPAVPGGAGLAPGQAERLRLEIMVPADQVPSFELGFY
ncbi:DUF3426 domain-containing protein [Alkalilimnicola ehrlichii MLHE-1]|uniref:DUF3426 domain-containing protein n=1 Tax=Alkalilimnicola ehrlichii (strain ATCC BAA-1101 / DSM 17681 / MLHE-1) TaxID=187272 RepID=Q0AB24_ALKEH|nr:DUF3426 domain-containing protein [Alkalilimnicola ehrlichii]ABI55963.1 hypothetical protein Mlg_0609 [Alkalilimnicola ehrlichii MLHE-1]